MTFKELAMSRHLPLNPLIRLSGLPRTTVFNLWEGKSNLLQCRLQTVTRLASLFGMTIEEMITALNMEPASAVSSGSAAAKEEILSALQQIRNMATVKRSRRLHTAMDIAITTITWSPDKDLGEGERKSDNE